MCGWLAGRRAEQQGTELCAACFGRRAVVVLVSEWVSEWVSRHATKQLPRERAGDGYVIIVVRWKHISSDTDTDRLKERIPSQPNPMQHLLNCVPIPTQPTIGHSDPILCRYYTTIVLTLKFNLHYCAKQTPTHAHTSKAHQNFCQCFRSRSIFKY